MTTENGQTVDKEIWLRGWKMFVWIHIEAKFND